LGENKPSLVTLSPIKFSFSPEAGFSGNQLGNFTPETMKAGLFLLFGIETAQLFSFLK
jgi:hypothetical protein